MTKLDEEKKQALDAAKKEWSDKPEAKSKANTHEITKHKGGDVVVSTADLPECCVLHFKTNANTNFVVEAKGVVKLMVETCRGCTITIKNPLVTGHCEVWSCKNTTLYLEVGVPTLQVDMCKGLTIGFPERVHLGQIVQAAVQDMKVEFRRCPEDNFETTFAKLQAENPELEDDDKSTQFITRFVEGELMTEKVIRMINDYPTTLRESKSFTAKGQATEEKVEEFMKQRNLTESEKAELEEMKSKMSTLPDDLTPEARALAKKQKGNEEFKGGNIPQALVHYTESILIKSTSAVRANRAQCFLQLGKYNEAVEDCDECIKDDPDYVKAHFRRGLALMKLERYREAGACFSKTLELEPKNKAAKSSMGLVEMNIMKQMRAGKK